eukprot:2887566-Pleurochrysis_carterae.AAC.1
MGMIDRHRIAAAQIPRGCLAENPPVSVQQQYRGGSEDAWNEGSLIGCPVESLPCERQTEAVSSPLYMLATSHAAMCDLVLSLRPNHLFLLNATCTCHTCT